MIKILWAAGSNEKQRQSVKPRRPPTNTARRQRAALLLGATLLLLPISQHDLWPYSHPDRRSLWQPYPLNSLCLHEHWSTKLAVRQKRDAEILNVNTHQTQRSFNYITATGSHCLKCVADFFYSQLSCLLWLYLWPYIYTNLHFDHISMLYVPLYEKQCILSEEKQKEHLQSVRLQSLNVHTEPGL